MAKNIRDPSVFHSYASETGPDDRIAGEALGAVEPIYRSQASRSSRDSRTDRHTHMGNDLTSRGVREMMKASNDAYYDPGLGLLRNVIDMMSSFGAQGIRILHPNKNKQAFYNAWAAQVEMPLKAERFFNMLYRLGNVVVKRNVAKLSQRQIEAMKRSVAAYSPDIKFQNFIRPSKNEIPIEYTFLNPTSVDTVEGDLAAFLGEQVYILRMPNTLLLSIKTPKTPTQRELVARLPAWIRDPIQAGQRYVQLDNDMVSVYHYMKDDWMQWSVPIIQSILTDLKLYKQMKLADNSALESVIGRIRIWNVGSLEHKIQPGSGAITTLQDILMSNEGGGPLDLVWDDTLRLHETSTDTHQFLGSAKYGPVLQSIYAGLGIPQSLTGGSEKGGFTNNAISLKTLLERLSYGRQVSNKMWYKELRLVKEAIGDRQEPVIVYDNMNLYDEASVKSLWIQLYDRHLASDETVQEYFGMIPEIESRKIARNAAARTKGKLQPKAGPYSEGQPEYQMQKIALQQGTVALSEVGVDKKPKKKGDKSLLEIQSQNQKTADKRSQINIDEKQPGVSGQGKPVGSKDKGPRKQRQALPRSSASEIVQVSAWARDAQRAIADIVTPVILDKYDRKNVRSLNGEQAAELERTKLGVLWATQPYENIDASGVVEKMTSSLLQSDEIYDFAKSLLTEAKIPKTADNLREMQASAYAILKGKSNGETSIDG